VSERDRERARERESEREREREREVLCVCYACVEVSGAGGGGWKKTGFRARFGGRQGLGLGLEEDTREGMFSFVFRV
jgi:hypothetical protein